MSNDVYDKLTSAAIGIRIECQNWDKHLESIGDLSFRNSLRATVAQMESIVRKADEMKVAGKENSNG